MPPSTMIMYTDSNWPRVLLVAASLIQLSATTYRPAKQNPVITRIMNQEIGDTKTVCSRAAPDASEARAAKTRMWPTLASRRGTIMDPARKPAK